MRIDTFSEGTRRFNSRICPMAAESLATIQVDGAQIAYRRIGNGRPLVALNGFAATSADWDPSFIDRLASSNQLILLDNRGIGGSTDDGQPFDIARLADDAARVIEILGIERTSLLGWPMGGFIAQTLALQHPGRINKRLKNRRVDCCHWFFRVTSRNPFIANSAISWQRRVRSYLPISLIVRPRRETRGTALASGTGCEK